MKSHTGFDSEVIKSKPHQKLYFYNKTQQDAIL
jgi:hypothetical protein